MQSKLLTISCLLFSWSCAGSQQTVPAPSPSTTDLIVGNANTIIGVTTSLKRLPSDEDIFESKEDSFRIHLPRWPELERAAVFPPPGGEPQAGRVIWQMQEAEIALSIVPMPPGLITSWSREQLRDELTQTMLASISKIRNHRVVHGKEIDHRGMSGREAKVVAGEFTIFARLFIANDRQFMLIAQFQDPATEALVKKVFDTFEVTK